MVVRVVSSMYHQRGVDHRCEFLAFRLVGYHVADPFYSTFLSSLDKVDGSLVLSMYTVMTNPSSVICNVINYTDFPTTVHKRDILRGPIRRSKRALHCCMGKRSMCVSSGSVVMGLGDWMKVGRYRSVRLLWLCP